MSEFKFACPVCGQHITADSSAAGSRLDCPTCFRKIVVPQAPASAESKFVLSASEANKPRPSQAALAAALPPMSVEPVRRTIPMVAVLSLSLVCAAGATLLVFREKIFKHRPETAENNGADNTGDSTPELGAAPNLGTNIVAWTLDLADAAFPDGPPTGKLHDRDFASGRAILQGGALTLRYGNAKSTDFGLNVFLPANLAEELNGKSVSVTANNATAPWVTLHWKEEQVEKKETFKNGYAMKLEFGTIKGNRMPGKIYLCLPDPQQSRVAGTFNAEVRKPSPPKPKTPKTN